MKNCSYLSFILTISLLFRITVTAYSQSIDVGLPEIVPASPTAASIAKYHNYPVNYSTGLVQIEIPLYEIKSGSLTIPISISYHASGIKVNENAGPIGLGWTLNAEPLVSRSVIGNPDESPSGILNNRTTGGNRYNLNLADGEYEETPDDFYYKIPEKSGRFYFKKTYQTTSPYQIVPQPYEPLGFVFTHNTTESKFEITDENGVYYRFGGSFSGADVFEHTRTTLNDSKITAWKAAEIIARNTGDTISFSYTDYTEFIKSYTDVVTIDDYVNGTAYESLLYNCNSLSFPIVSYRKVNDRQRFYSVNSNGTLKEETACMGTNLILPHVSEILGKRISTINFRGGRAVFTGTDGKISQIMVYDKSNVARQKITFHQTNFTIINDTGGSNPARLRLDGVTIQDMTTGESRRYNFSYATSSLPGLACKAQDHWGYYNGKTSQAQNSVPQTTTTGFRPLLPETVPFTIGEGDKSPDADYMKYGILTRITYPTKGYTQFDYEPHEYKYQNNNYISGGLRIKSIEDYDPSTGKGIYRLIKYGDYEVGASVGMTANHITEEDYMFEQNTYYYVHGGRSRKRTYYSRSLTDLFYASGSPVVYDKVTELRSSSLTNPGELGKTEYRYFQPSYERPSYREGLTTIYKNPRDDWEFGHLITCSVLGQSGDTISRTDYTYDKFKTGTITFGEAYRMDIYNFAGAPSGHTEPYDNAVHVVYNQYTGVKKMVSETKREKFASGGMLTQTTNYSYNVSLKPHLVSQSTSDGNTQSDRYYYVNDLSLSGTAETGRAKLESNGSIGTLLKHEHTKDAKTSVTQVDYKFTDGKVLPDVIKTGKGINGTLEARTRYHSYDKYGNPTCVSLEGGPKTTYLWGYNSQYPIARIENASYDEVKQALGSSYLPEVIAAKPMPSQSDYTRINGLRQTLSNVLVTTFTYHPLKGIASETDPSGKTFTYTYDSATKKLIVRDNNGKTVREEVVNYAQ